MPSLTDNKKKAETFDINRLIEMRPFSLEKGEKTALYRDALHELTKLHYTNCPEYRKILDTLGIDPSIKYATDAIPFIPVRLFKDYELLSVEKSQVVKIMTSSGTTSKNVSRIFLDRITAANQTKVLMKIVTDFIGSKRLPMLVIDAESTLKDRNLLSARSAGILGFSIFGTDITYALNNDMQLDFDRAEAFCNKHKDEKILVFGFTYMIWENFYKKLIESGKQLDLRNGIIIHGGGWKKLNQEAVDNETFKRALEKVCKIKRIHNYYGMVEQTGSIFMECEAGYLHCSIFSDVIIRNTDFSVSGLRKTGLTQLISLLPLSYPGHSILSEDIGEIIGEDNCSCGRKGKYFKIHGRIKDAELRGCSDVYAAR